MRKSTETPDQLAMVAGKMRVGFQPGGFKQVYRPILVLQILTVHQWHVQKGQLLAGKLPVETPVDGMQRHFYRLRLRGKRDGLTAKHVERKLVEQDGQRQASLSGLHPGRQLSASGLLPDRPETFPDLCVQVRR